MPNCFSLTEARTSCYRSAFTNAGLRPTVTHIHDGRTAMHCWVPTIASASKPNLLLLHGLGASCLWQWHGVVRRFSSSFNLFVPDLLFFGGSYTALPDRSDSFQAQCVMRVMEANSVARLSLVGLSYGGFVGYSMADQLGDVVERVVVCCSGICMEEKDLREGVFRVSDLEEASRILVPETAAKLRELMSYTFFKPPPMALAMCKEYVQEKKELIKAISRDRKLSNIPRISQPTLIIWGEHDHVFPLELGHRLKRHLGDNAELVVIRKAGHIFNVEKPKEFYKHLYSFLVNSRPPALSNQTHNNK